MTWTPATSQAETWTAVGQATSLFDPAVFANDPVFDTALRVGNAWAANAKQAETWTEIS